MNSDRIIREYAGFWVRFAAMLIDTTILLLGVLIVFSPLLFVYLIFYQIFPAEFDPFLNQARYFFSEHLLSIALLDFGPITLILLLLTAWCWRRFRATPGKMAFKLEVVDADSGKTLTTGQSFGRYFAYILSAIPLFLGFIWVAFDKRKQGWHDKLANTVVIKKRKAPVKIISEET